MWYNMSILITNAPALLLATQGVTTHERMCSMPHYNRVCPTCQKEFSTSKKQTLCCSISCGKYHAKQPVGIRFWDKVFKSPEPNGCWLWQGKLNSKGYGTTTAWAKTISTHRLSYILEHGSIPEDMHVLHKCDVRNCVRPDHLFIGTNHDNVLDCLHKGRKVIPDNSGSNHGMAKLTEVDVSEILKLHREGVNNIELSKMFKTADGNISRIVNGLSWKHVQ
jgi:hypothetical protein